MPSTARVGEIASILKSGNDARQALGQALVLLSSAYNVSDTYAVGPLGSGTAAANTQYLDGIRLRAEADYAALPANDEALADGTRNQVAFDIASIETATNQTLSIFGGSTAIGDLADSVKDTVTDAVTAVADALPTPPGGYWLWIGAAVALVLFLRFKK